MYLVVKNVYYDSDEGGQLKVILSWSHDQQMGFGHIQPKHDTSQAIKKDN